MVCPADEHGWSVGRPAWHRSRPSATVRVRVSFTAEGQNDTRIRSAALREGASPVRNAGIATATAGTDCLSAANRASAIGEAAHEPADRRQELTRALFVGDVSAVPQDGQIGVR